MRNYAIYKYTLDVTERQELLIPIGAKLLCVQMQGREPQLWALVLPGEVTERYTIDMYGTGSVMAEHPGDYLGTIQLNNGTLVFHYFRNKSI